MQRFIQDFFRKKEIYATKNRNTDGRLMQRIFREFFPEEVLKNFEKISDGSLECHNVRCIQLESF